MLMFYGSGAYHMRKRKAVKQRPEPLPKEPLVILLVRLRLEIAQHLFLKIRVAIY